jgi:hypothetical protein
MPRRKRNRETVREQPRRQRYPVKLLPQELPDGRYMVFTDLRMEGRSALMVGKWEAGISYIGLVLLPEGMQFELVHNSWLNRGGIQKVNVLEIGVDTSGFRTPRLTIEEVGPGDPPRGTLTELLANSFEVMNVSS